MTVGPLLQQRKECMTGGIRSASAFNGSDRARLGGNNDIATDGGASSGMTKYLAVRHGKQRGVCWPVEDEAVTIGRSEQCSIRIVDAAISRRHCKVWLEEDDLFVEDLNSRNATMVNGMPVKRAKLRIGDILAVGPATFEVINEPANAVPNEKESAYTPVTISVEHGVYTSENTFKPVLQPTPRTVNELYELFCLSRDLAYVETLWDLARLTRYAFKRLLDPSGFWLAWYRSRDSRLVYVNVGEPDQVGPPPEELMRKAIEAHTGLLAPRVYKDEEGRVLETTMALPLVYGNGPVGVVALRGTSPGRSYTEEDLQYALGIVATIAPHVRAVEHLQQLARDNERLREASGASQELLGESPVMRDLRNLISRAAQSDISALILGETGAGKEIVARMIHEQSSRQESPYVVINCAAIPSELLESEMFGHEKGAFTGAAKRRIGRMEEANGGTLFLDEVADLSAENQARLLRAIETGIFRRVGGEQDIQSDVRIIAATNKSLSSDRFRSDLLHRLNSFTIHVPALRARLSDVPILARHFLKKYCQGCGVTDLSPEALRLLQQHSWPGNVRELKATIERAVLFCDGPVLKPEHLNLSQHSENNGSEAPLRTLAEIERQHILKVVQATSGNISAAARTLGINRVTLYKRLAEYGEQASVPDSE